MMFIKTDRIIHGIPLAMAEANQWFKVVGVNGGKNLAKRIRSMGMMIDTQVQVLQHRKGTGLVVACGETRLAVGAGMAHKILVVPA